MGSYYNSATCEYFCDLRGSGTDSQCDLGDALCPYDYINKAKYAGQANLTGQTVNRYVYSEDIVIVKVKGPNMGYCALGPYSCAVYQANHEFDTLASQNTIPVRQFHEFIPFGKWLENVTITMTSKTPCAWLRRA